jgi:hypothetical protein
MSDVTKRIAQWNLKYDPARIKEITEAGKPAYSQRVAAVFPDMYQTEISVKQVLDGQGVSVADVADYLCFGREMWSKSKKFSGALLVKEAATLIAKWKDRGMSQAVLEAIRSEVFNVGPPTPV